MASYDLSGEDLGAFLPQHGLSVIAQTGLLNNPQRTSVAPPFGYLPPKLSVAPPVNLPPAFLRTARNVAARKTVPSAFSQYWQKAARLRAMGHTGGYLPPGLLNSLRVNPYARMGDEYTGDFLDGRKRRFLPGLTRVVKSVVAMPFKAVGGAVKGVMSAPIGVARAVKYAAVGSKKKPQVSRVRYMSKSGELLSTGPQAASSQAAQASYGPTPGIPTITLPPEQYSYPQQQSSGGATEQATGGATGSTTQGEGAAGKFPVLLLVAGLGVAAFLFMKKKGVKSGVNIS